MPKPRGRYDYGSLLTQIEDVEITDAADNDVLQYDLATGLWKNESSPMLFGNLRFRADGNDAGNRFRVRASDGQLGWGNGTDAVDTNLYRDSANTLKTDDRFVMGANWTWEGASIGNWEDQVKDILLFDGAAGGVSFTVGTRQWFFIDTGASRELSFGNVTDNPAFSFNGIGTASFGGDVDIAGVLTAKNLTGGGSLSLLGTSETEFNVAAYYTAVTETAGAGPATPYELKLSGVFTGTSTTAYEFEIDDATSGAETFKWRKNVAGGGFGGYTSGVSVQTVFTTLEDGLEYVFKNNGSDTFNVGDKWEFTADSTPINVLNVDTSNTAVECKRMLMGGVSA